MSRFNAPPPNGDIRKMIEQRAREAARPAEPEKKGSWPFCANKEPFAAHPEARAAARAGQEKSSG